VVIPAYNAAATIGVAIESVLEQDYPDVELIVVDDGSTDDTASIARAYGDRVSVVQTPNRGPSAARNAALERCTGELVAFLDADDLWLEGKLSRQVDLLSEVPEIDATYCAVAFGDPSGDVRMPDPPDRGVDVTRALLLNLSAVFASQSTLLVRREALDRMGPYDPGIGTDYDMKLRLSLVARFCPMDDVLAVYRPDPGGLNHNTLRVAREVFRTLDKFYARSDVAAYRDIRREVYGRHAAVYAGTFLADGDRVRAAQWALRAIGWHPRLIGRVAATPLRRFRRRLSSSASAS
jgi:glycosyltransferase involved in cell wall biosynthesis